MPRVRVVPTTDALRAVLKHANGMGFRSAGSVEWPLDKFTKRRLADGSVRLEQKPKNEEKPELKNEEKPEQKSEDRPAPPHQRKRAEASASE
jgi:hypothetical protein